MDERVEDEKVSGKEERGEERGESGRKVIRDRGENGEDGEVSGREGRGEKEMEQKSAG